MNSRNWFAAKVQPAEMRIPDRDEQRSGRSSKPMPGLAVPLPTSECRIIRAQHERPTQFPTSAVSANVPPRGLVQPLCKWLTIRSKAQAASQ